MASAVIGGVLATATASAASAATPGVVTEYSSGINSGATPLAITAGPDGNLWFTEFNLSGINQTDEVGLITIHRW